ncbi:NUDIX pyrophosphatase, partial [Bacillus sp. SRB_28]
HSEYKWVTYEEAREILKWDSNRVAIWELHQRLIRESSK